MQNKNLTLLNDEELENIGDALSSPTRRKILALVTKRSYSVLELAKELNIALSTMSFHIKVLRTAGLVKTLSSPDKRGNEKNVSQSCYEINIQLSKPNISKKNTYNVELPIGSYSSFDITAPCVMANENQIIGDYDEVGAFYSTERFEAKLISFKKGYVEYKIPTYPFANKKIASITFSLEICSECPNYNNHWKSDISFWLNDILLCTYRSPGDYGDRRGLLNPSWWPEKFTQYGMLKKIRIDEEGVWLDESLVSDMTINNFQNNGTFLSFKFGVDENSKYAGGINIFGKNFGDHNQDIMVQISFLDD